MLISDETHQKAVTRLKHFAVMATLDTAVIVVLFLFMSIALFSLDTFTAWTMSAWLNDFLTGMNLMDFVTLWVLIIGWCELVYHACAIFKKKE